MTSHNDDNNHDRLAQEEQYATVAGWIRPEEELRLTERNLHVLVE